METHRLALSQVEFNRLVTDHGPTLYRMAYRMVGNRHEAEDVVQDTFRSAWKSRASYHEGQARHDGPARRDGPGQHDGQLSRPEGKNSSSPAVAQVLPSPELRQNPAAVAGAELVDGERAELGDREVQHDPAVHSDQAVQSDRVGHGERAWLASILRRRVVDRWRKRSWPNLVTGQASLEDSVDGADPLANDFTDEMQGTLGRLSPDLKEALLLVVVGELTHQETADLLKIPLGTVLSRVSRARQRLREYLMNPVRTNAG